MVDTKILIDDIRRMVDEARTTVAATVSTGLTLLHWQIGKRINAEILDGGRAKYGKQILATLSQILSSEYGKGFNNSA
ncbi:MAG: cytoplasmic protein, partial [Deltaproteobacteria bacterium]|nr:cytoplasmic protein [Deltaproteobacteria bacterium]